MMNNTNNVHAHAPVQSEALAASGDGHAAPSQAPILNPAPTLRSTVAALPEAGPLAQSAAERLARQAQQWSAYALSVSRLHPATVYDKTLASLLFCLDNRARDFAVPSKLAGTSRYQFALRRLDDLNPLQGHPLATSETEGGELLVRFGSTDLGCVQGKHAAWLAPLLRLGASVRFLAVSGQSRHEGYLGCNVALAGLGAAMARLEAGQPAPVTPGEDVYLWRTRSGAAMSTVTASGRHSDTVEWGYSGSGPAELAYSVLIRFAPPHAAETLYQSYKDDVIAPMRHEGGVIRASSVVAWLCRRCAL